MKLYRAYIAIGLIGWSLHSMASEPVKKVEDPIQTEQNSSILPVEIWFGIIEKLFPLESSEEVDSLVTKAVAALKAYSVIDKDACNFFKTNEQFTTLLAQWVDRFAYYHDVDATAIMEKLLPILSRETYSVHVKEKDSIKEFVEVLDSCAKTKDWKPAYDASEKIRVEKHLLYYLKNYYWKGSYLSHPAKWTILTYALYLEAPEDLINKFITCKPWITHFSPQTPPPLVIVSNTIAKLSADKTDQDDSIAKNTESSKRIFNALIEKGASLDDFFSYKLEDPYSIIQALRAMPNILTMKTGINELTPLVVAIHTNTNDLLQLLIEKGAPLTRTSFITAVQSFLNSENSALKQKPLELMLHACIAGKEAELFCLFTIFVMHINDLFPEKYNNFKNKIHAIINLFIKEIAHSNNYSKEKAASSLLAIAKLCFMPEDSIAFLVEQGAQEIPEFSEFLDEKVLKALNIREKLMQIWPHLVQGQPIEKELLKNTLKEVLTLLADSNCKQDIKSCVYPLIPIILVSDFFLESEEGFEFLSSSEISTLFPLYMPTSKKMYSLLHLLIEGLEFLKQQADEDTFQDGLHQTIERMHPLVFELALKGRNTYNLIAAQSARELGFDKLAQIIEEALQKTPNCNG